MLIINTYFVLILLALASNITAAPSKNIGRKVASHLPGIQITMGRAAGVPGGPSMARLIFDKFDADHSGKINRSEFQALCYDKGHLLNKEGLDEAMIMIDEDGSGEISFEEFQKWWSDKDRFGHLKLDEHQQCVLNWYEQKF